MELHDALLALTRGSYGDTRADVTVASVVAALVLVPAAWALVRSGSRHSGHH